MEKEILPVSIGISEAQRRSYIVQYNNGTPQTFSNYGDFQEVLRTYVRRHPIELQNDGAEEGRPLTTAELLGIELSDEKAICRDMF